MQHEVALARVGRVLRGKWRLDRLLGVGGMAAVYAATHRNAMRGAVKMLHPHLSRDPEIRRRFVQEGYAANVVQHPGVVRALDDDEADDGSAFVVLELLEGESVESRRTRHEGGKLPPPEVLQIADQLLDVLAAAHEKGIVHRDIKPDNLFVCADGRLKVLDFGIARLRGEGIASTAPGAAMGTPAFMAPEQARGERDQVGPRSDLFATGATLFQLLSGQYVHEATTLPELVTALCTRQVRSLAAAWPEAPPSLVALVDRALAFAPGDRWPDAKTMQHAVRDAYRGLTGQPLEASPHLEPPLGHAPTVLSVPPASGAATTGATSATTAATPPLAPKARPWRTLGIVGAVAVLGGGALLWGLVSPSSSPTQASASLPPSSPPSAPSSSPSPATVPPAPALRSVLKVRVAGGSCRVRVDGIDLGDPPQDATVPPGPHKVACGDTVHTVEAAAGESLLVPFQAPAAPVASAAPSAAPPRTASPSLPKPSHLDRRGD